MNRVMHFEIGADDPTRAADFYTNVFGWEIKCFLQVNKSTSFECFDC